MYCPVPPTGALAAGGMLRGHDVCAAYYREPPQSPDFPPRGWRGVPTPTLGDTHHELMEHYKCVTAYFSLRDSRGLACFSESGRLGEPFLR